MMNTQTQRSMYKTGNKNIQTKREQKYSVIYSKQSYTNNLSRGGRTSKSDGILTVAPFPSCLVTLEDISGGDNNHDDDVGEVEKESKRINKYEESSSEESSSEASSSEENGSEEMKGMNIKKRMQAFRRKRNQAQKKKYQKKKLKLRSRHQYNRQHQCQKRQIVGRRGGNVVVYSGINSDIAKRISTTSYPENATMTGKDDIGAAEKYLKEDEIIFLPRWKCQIISLLPSKNVNEKDAIVQESNETKGLLPREQSTKSMESSYLSPHQEISNTCEKHDTSAPSLQQNSTLNKKRAITDIGMSLKRRRLTSCSVTTTNKTNARSNILRRPPPLPMRNFESTLSCDHNHLPQRKIAHKPNSGNEHDSNGNDDDNHCNNDGYLHSTNIESAQLNQPTGNKIKKTSANEHRRSTSTVAAKSIKYDYIHSHRFNLLPSSTSAKTQKIDKSTIQCNKTRAIEKTASAKALRSAYSSIGNDFPGSIGTIQSPYSIKSMLRPHQRSGVTFLWNCLTAGVKSIETASPPGVQSDESDFEENDKQKGQNSLSPMRRINGCILADEMGLGKTLMTIAVIFALHRRKKDDRFIVVCPSSLVTNWGKEFDKWLGKASQPKRVIVIKGGEEGLKTIRSFVPLKPHKSEVLIISYELFRINFTLFSESKNIGLLVVDEGHRLKNAAGSLTLSALNTLPCQARLLITGTPIQNNLAEFYNMANFACPGILGDLNTFRNVYERPISAANKKNATRDQKDRGKTLGKSLEFIASTFMLRRLQKDILTSILPPRTEVLLFCRPSKTQCKLYKELTSGALIAGGGADALTLLLRVRKLCSHPCLLEESNNKMWSTNKEIKNKNVSMSGKLEVLGKLLASIRKECANDKVVIVSNFTSVLTVIDNFILKKNGWASIRLDGSIEQSERQPLVDSFNRSNAVQRFVFLLSAKAGGCGLNLIGANRLVMFDPDWNPATDMQAMARVYRQGQTKPCFIYRFFTSGSVEEVIYQRQMQKSNLASLTVDNKNSLATNKSSKSARFTKEELQDCFTLKEGCACDTKNKIGARWNDYKGVDSLKIQGCIDEPLQQVAKDKSDALTFVHLVNQSTTDTPRSSLSDFEDQGHTDEDISVGSSEAEFLG